MCMLEKAKYKFILLKLLFHINRKTLYKRFLTLVRKDFYISDYDGFHSFYKYINSDSQHTSSLKLSKLLELNSKTLSKSNELLYILRTIKYETLTDVSKINHINQLSVNLFTADQWLVLYKLFATKRKFIFALLMREKAYQSIMTKLRPSSYDKFRKFQFMLEYETFENINAEITSLSRLSRFSLPYEEILDSFHMIFVNNHFSFKDFNNNANSLFSKLIFGKRIAIIGPTINENNSFRNFKDFDVIVVTNYRGYEGAFDFQGKTLISYYNNGDFFEIVDNNLFDANELSMTCLNPGVDLKYYSKVLNLNKLRIRLDFDYFLFSGSFSKILAIILDVKSYMPSAIKLFNVEFYTKGDNLPNNYRKPEENQFRVSYSKAYHDLFSQFNFTKKLYNNKIIDVDNNIKNILNLSVYEYAEVIENSIK